MVIRGVILTLTTTQGHYADLHRQAITLTTGNGNLRQHRDERSKYYLGHL